MHKLRKSVWPTHLHCRDWPSSTRSDHEEKLKWNVTKDTANDGEGAEVWQWTHLRTHLANISFLLMHCQEHLWRVMWARPGWHPGACQHGVCNTCVRHQDQADYRWDSKRFRTTACDGKHAEWMGCRILSTVLPCQRWAECSPWTVVKAKQNSYSFREYIKDT